MSESETVKHIDPMTHEVDGNLLFTEAGLSPYYGLQSITKGPDYGEGVSGTFELDGEEWEVTVRPSSSTLVPWDDPSFKFEKVKELDTTVRPVEAAENTDEQRKASFHIAPRWPNLESLGDSPPPSVPEGVGTGVNVRFRGSNLDLDDYPVLLRHAMDAVDIDPGYFADEHIHEYSNVMACERYPRINREKSPALIGRGGIFERIREHVATVEGSKWAHSADNRQIEGYNHQVRFASEGAGALMDGHALGKQLKHYHPKYVRSDPDPNDPLAHPKLGALYRKGDTDGNAAPWVTGGGSVRWDDRERLISELDELLINVLSWAGLTIRADYRTYVADSHFEATETESELSLIDNPLPEIKREQSDVVVSSLTESMPSDREVLEVMTDGGARSVDALAEESGYSTRTVYRVVSRLEDIITTRLGKVRFKSQYLRERATETLRTVREALESEDDSDADTSAWARYRAKYGVEVDDREGSKLKLRLGEVPSSRSLTDLLKDLYWSFPGDKGRFHVARIEYRQGGSNNVRIGFRPR